MFVCVYKHTTLLRPNKLNTNKKKCKHSTTQRACAIPHTNTNSVARKLSQHDENGVALPEVCLRLFLCCTVLFVLRLWLGGVLLMALFIAVFVAVLCSDARGSDYICGCGCGCLCVCGWRCCGCGCGCCLVGVVAVVVVVVVAVFVSVFLAVVSVVLCCGCGLRSCVSVWLCFWLSSRLFFVCYYGCVVSVCVPTGF